MSTHDSQKIECRSSKSANTFEWKMNCFLCGDKFESKKNFRNHWHLAATLEIQQTIEMRGLERMRENTDMSMGKQYVTLNTSKDYLQIDIKTTYISAMNQDEKILYTLKKRLITL